MASIPAPRSIAVGPDGSLYIADRGNNRARSVDHNGVITTVAGGGVGDQWSCDRRSDFDLEWYGNRTGWLTVHSSDRVRNRVRRVGPDGVITTVAGTGQKGYSGDGGPARSALLSNPSGVAVGPDGSLYIADSRQQCIRRVGPDGVITTVVANAVSRNYTDNVAVGQDGSLCISAGSNIIRVGPDDTISNIAGGGNA